MKKIFTLLTIFTFALLSFNGEAQTGKLTDPLKQDVMQGSVRKYVANGGTARATSKYEWSVQESTDGGTIWTVADPNAYKFVTGYEAYEKDASNNYVLDLAGKKKLLEMAVTNVPTVFILWTKSTDKTKKYRVRIDEKSSTSLCFDEDLNTNVVDVTIQENDFEISMTKWDQASGNTSTDGNPNFQCAVEKDNLIGFLVSKNGGSTKYADWKLSYEYRIVDNDGTTELFPWTRINDLSAVTPGDTQDIDTDSDKTELLGLIIIDELKYADLNTILIGDNGHITIEVRIVDAVSHLGLVAKNITSDLSLLPKECMASIKVSKIPAAQTIELD